MQLTAGRVAPLLLGSGFCSLVYQVSWLREFRLVFGASTAASAAVLAIFIGGLGLGGLLLGRRADASRAPLMLYGNLELVIAGTAAVSPFLLAGVRHVYIASGGSFSLGLAGGSALRLVLATLVLAIPTIAMGGTLAAVTRAIAPHDDARRRSLAIMYGTNTLGAVLGALATTFVLLEIFGTRKTIWVAALLNALIALFARSLARKAGQRDERDGQGRASAATSRASVDGENHARAATSGDNASAATSRASDSGDSDGNASAATSRASDSGDSDGSASAATSRASDSGDVGARVPRWFVLVASGIVGFAFFLMEMTWYRMLGPILGGTVFTFGLILAVALLGIGLGGLAYALRPAARAATVYGLALVCAIEAIGLAVPLALGDRIAFGASALRLTSVFGFAGQVAGWALIAGLVILPAAIAAGIQFPLLVNLVGRGREHVGRQLGLVYATNTIGAIAGSLLGGFLLLPALGAVGSWRLAIALLVAVAASALALGAKQSTRKQLATGGVAIAIAVLLVFAHGPTAAWRHGGIGAGRAAMLSTPTGAAGFVSDVNRSVVWEAEGIESTVALVKNNGLSFVVNGKIDGNAQIDAPTQMTGGLIGALIHPAPRRAMVIGLGTGETAGWLAEGPGVEHVDVIELEPAILEVARQCAVANRDVMNHPKVTVTVGDAREALLVSDATYDVVFSEPSNPYRAGVSSLYTREFYEAVRDRLGEDGLFLQWTQSYEVDGATIATIYATLGAVFGEVHTFRLLPADLLFVASKTPIRYDMARLVERMRTPAMRDAFSYAWKVEGAEGLLSHFLGDSKLAAEIASRAGGSLNTDDNTMIEFAFARSLGVSGLSNELPLRQTSVALGADRPPVDGPIDWAHFDELRLLADAAAGIPPMSTPNLTPDHLARAQARASYHAGNLATVATAWKQQSRAPQTHHDAVMVAEAFATRGEASDLTLLRPAEVALVRARLHATREQWPAAADQLLVGFTLLRYDVFVGLLLVDRAIQLAKTVADRDPAQAPQLVSALSQPLALYAQDEARILALLAVAAGTDPATIVAVLASLEPHVPWRRDVLVLRRSAYAAAKHPLLERAEDDLERFLSGHPAPLAGP